MPKTARQHSANVRRNTGSGHIKGGRENQRKGNSMPTYYELHKEEIQLKVREYRQKNRAKILARKKKYRKEHADEIKEKEAIRRKKPGYQEAHSEYLRQWRKDNPDKVQEERIKQRDKWREFAKWLKKKKTRPQK
jgi:dihydroorotate dehydrogenase